MSTEFLPKFAFIGVMNQMMSLSHVTFLTYVKIMLRTQTEDDHDNSTPPIKIMATMSGPISFITGLCTGTALGEVKTLPVLRLHTGVAPW